MPIVLPTPEDFHSLSAKEFKEREFLERLLIGVENRLLQNYAIEIGKVSLTLNFEGNYELFEIWERLTDDAKARIQHILCSKARASGWFAAEIAPGRMGPETVPHFLVVLTF